MMVDSFGELTDLPALSLLQPVVGEPLLLPEFRPQPVKLLHDCPSLLVLLNLLDLLADS